MTMAIVPLVALFAGLGLALLLLPSQRTFSDFHHSEKPSESLTSPGRLSDSNDYSLTGIAGSHESGENTATGTLRAPRTELTTWRITRGKESLNIAFILTEVSALLRAGEPTAQAWRHACKSAGLPWTSTAAGEGDIPQVLLDKSLSSRPCWLPVIHRGALRWNPPTSSRLDDYNTARVAFPAAQAACALSRETGAPLADVLDGVVAGISELAQVQAAREQALAAPQATARLMAVLPVLGLFLAQGLGVNAWGYLIHHSFGHVCLGAGIFLSIGGYVLTQWFTSPFRRVPLVDQVTVIDLAAAALGSGGSIPDCLGAVGRATQTPQLETVGRCLLLGGTWSESWEAGYGKNAAFWPPLHRALEPGWNNGADPGPLLHSMAQSIRDGRQAEHHRLVQQLSIRLVIPLGLFHLPAFFCLTIFPVLFSLVEPFYPKGV
ncbi:hypothetical protein [Actinomyces vulturis]|uniref:hypothetical protein n=1 Tax=Actinomyces vulturis TaxID=1857645 RepID=UPI000832F89E|nr:hypothetical protein [Actinomyces vulturis]